MNKLLPLIAFSVLLLVPAGVQNAFAQSQTCTLIDFEGVDTSVLLGTIGDVTFTPPQEPVIGGEIIPIESTSLLLASAQTFSWMIPVVLSVLGIGLFVVSRKSK